MSICDSWLWSWEAYSSWVRERMWGDWVVEEVDGERVGTVLIEDVMESTELVPTSSFTD